ncbi:MAG: hypothetical protein NT027_04240, partial [Proteobacteria bacterium]|nr:hypothetical protein [Pseudomonadota bacterium]
MAFQRLLSFVLLFSLFAISCKEAAKKSKGNDSQPNAAQNGTNPSPSTVATPAQSPTPSNSPGSSNSLNTSRVGDSYVQLEELKSWSYSVAEPQEWATRVSRTVEIRKLYDSSQNCKYRQKTSVDDLKVPSSASVVSESDALCKSTSFQCGSTPVCVTSALPNATVGPFADSTGEHQVCIVVSCNGTAMQTVTKTDTNIWKHKTALSPDSIVKLQEKKCSMALAHGDKASAFPDACDFNKSRTVLYSKRSIEVKSQSQGPSISPVYSKFGSTSNINLTKSPAKGAMTAFPATCKSTGNSIMAISLRRNFCDGTNSMLETLDFTNIDLTLPKRQNSNKLTALTNEVSLNYITQGASNSSAPICPASTSRKYSMAAGGTCTFTLSGNQAEGVLVGSGNCTKDFIWWNPQTRVYESVGFKDFNFVCDAANN